MKKFLALVLVLALMAVLLCACSSSKEATPAETTPASTDATATTTEPAETTEAKGGKKIVYVSRNLNDMYAAFLVKVFENKIATDYPDWSMEVLDLQEDFSKSPDFIENAITMGADGIIGHFMNVNPVDTARKVGEENGVPVVAFDALYPESVGALAMVNADNYRMGHMIGELAAELLPENGRVAILSIGRKMDVVVQRDDGIGAGDGAVAAGNALGNVRIGRGVVALLVRHGAVDLHDVQRADRNTETAPLAALLIDLHNSFHIHFLPCMLVCLNQIYTFFGDGQTRHTSRYSGRTYICTGTTSPSSSSCRCRHSSSSSGGQEQ